MSRRSSILRTILLTLLIVALSSIGYGLRLYQDHHHTPPKTNASPVIRPSYHPGKIPKVGRLLLATQSGSGNYTTPVFATTDNWNVYWEFECDEDSLAHFQITAVSSKGQSASTSQPVNYSGKISGYGTLHYHQKASYYLKISTTDQCNWHVTVKSSS